MNYLLRATTVATIVIVLGTAAFAVAETQRYGAEGIPTVVAPVTRSVTPTESPRAVVATATVPATPPPPAAPSGSASGGEKKAASDSSGKKSSSRRDAPAPDTWKADSDNGDEPEREVVKPEVRDDDDDGDREDTADDESDDESSDAESDDDSRDESQSSEDDGAHESDSGD